MLYVKKVVLYALNRHNNAQNAKILTFMTRKILFANLPTVYLLVLPVKILNLPSATNASTDIIKILMEHVLNAILSANSALGQLE